MADTCIHELDPDICGYCKLDALMAAEPRGHRGHPDESEVARADQIRERLIRVLGMLAADGVERPMPFFAEMARLTARELHLEDWGPGGNPVVTIKNILDGHAAKHWSMDVIEGTCENVENLLS